VNNITKQYKSQIISPAQLQEEERENLRFVMEEV